MISCYNNVFPQYNVFPILPLLPFTQRYPGSITSDRHGKIYWADDRKQYTGSRIIPDLLLF